MNKNEMGITIKKNEDVAEWYGQVVQKSELADYSSVKGCAVIRPLGYAIWQNIQDYFNARLKVLGVQNAYFPMFIPEGFFQKEATHVEGFAPEVAWIDQKTDSEERLAIRPTSETVMYDSYSRWIRSYRDLPLLINQWCNIVRWEVKDVKLFLRSREFLWQEGHCVFETESECDKHAVEILEEYQNLSEELLAMPAFIGKKSENDKFPGAKTTYAIEGFMPDGKAIQNGTTHNLGQGFAKAFNITFQGRDEKDHHPWQSSWGFSTRLVGAMIMLHSDDKGLILPPRVAPTKAVIVPILNRNKPELSAKVLAKAKEVQEALVKAKLDVKLDDREEYSPGFKFNEWELKGVPLRIELGPRDLDQGTCVIAKRNDGAKITADLKEVVNKVLATLEHMHKELFEKALKERDEKMLVTQDYDAMVKHIKDGGFVLTHHCGGAACEDEIQTETNGITTRCRPMDNETPDKDAICVKCGKPAMYKILFARNY